MPNVAAHRLDVQVNPPVTTLRVDNEIKLQRKACQRRNIRLRMNVTEDDTGFTRARLTGEFPNRCREFELVRVLLSETDQVIGAFDARWSELGGSWSGGSRDDVVPESAVTVYEQKSLPLGDLIRFVNKFSNNVMARQVFLTLGAEHSEPPASLSKSRTAVLAALTALGVGTDGMYVDNGAGLSRDARITATTLIDMFDVAWRHRYGSDFFAALPIPGVDGTLKARFDKGRYIGQAHVKTGTLDHVIGMGGMVQAHNGRRYLVAFLINHHNVHKGAGLSLQKKLMRLLVTRDVS
ncbi:MAG: D-alanyl-D-alanine carboxypeptidase/D-alanyl-D-alanine-endopeptidase [Gammaproteobacteria bacterium]